MLAKHISNVITKTLDVETEAKAEAAGLETESAAKALASETEAQGSWSIFFSYYVCPYH